MITTVSHYRLAEGCPCRHTSNDSGLVIGAYQNGIGNMSVGVKEEIMTFILNHNSKNRFPTEEKNVQPLFSIVRRQRRNALTTIEASVIVNLLLIVFSTVRFTVFSPGVSNALSFTHL